MATTGAALRLILLLTFVSPETELPLGLSWGGPDTEFFDAMDRWADNHGVMVGKGVFDSSVDSGFYVVIGQYGLEDANDNDLGTAAYYNSNRELIGITARTRVFEANPFYVVAELERTLGGSGAEYLPSPSEGTYRFAFSTPEHSTVATLRQMDEGASGEWEIWVAMTPHDSDRRISELFPYVLD